MNAVAGSALTARRAWQRVLPFFVLALVATLLLYQATARAMVWQWRHSDTFAHGFLVPPIVLWLVWRQRLLLARYTPQPDGRALPLLALAGFGWLLGDLVAINAVTQLSLVGLLVLLVPALLGWAVARALVFPLGFLFFAVPLGEFAMPQLMLWTADFTVLALRLSGIPVLREGLQFVIPSGTWSVVEACSGVRYLIASLTIGVLFAYLNYQSMYRRALFILLSVLVPVIANWLRAYMIVMLGHFSGNTLATGVDHLIYGWVFFGVVMLLMFFIGTRWAEPEPEQVVDAASSRIPSGRMPLLPPTPAGNTGEALAADEPPASAAVFSSKDRRRWRAVAWALLVLLALPPAARWAIDAADPTAVPLLLLPAVLSPAWVASAEPVAVFKPSFQNPSAEVNATYQSQSMRVGLYLAYYRKQDFGRKLVSSANLLVAAKDPLWTQVAGGRRQVDLAGQAQPVRSAELRGTALPDSDAQARLQVWQIYWVNGTWTASDTQAKLVGALHRLLGQGDDAAVLVFYAPKGQAGAGEAALAAFVQANAQALVTLLQQTKAQR